MAVSSDDKLEILNLLGKYNFAIDFGDPKAWADTFTADGVFESPHATAKGRTELEAFARSAAKFEGARHWINNVIVEGDGNEATTKAYVVVYLMGGEAGPKVVVTGVYHDTLTKADGAWKFTQRTVSFDAKRFTTE